MTTLNDDFGPRFRQEQREREEFLRNTRESNRTTTVTEQIEAAIAEHHGNARDALNATLARLDAANALLEIEQGEQGRSAMLLDAPETIRALIWAPGGPRTETERVVDKIAQDVLRASGEIAMSTTEED